MALFLGEMTGVGLRSTHAAEMLLLRDRTHYIALRIVNTYMPGIHPLAKRCLERRGTIYYANSPFLKKRYAENCIEDISIILPLFGGISRTYSLREGYLLSCLCLRDIY